MSTMNHSRSVRLAMLSVAITMGNELAEEATIRRQNNDICPCKSKLKPDSDSNKSTIFCISWSESPSTLATN